jgi:replication factor A1
MTEEMKIEKLSPLSRKVDAIVKVVSKGEIRNVDVGGKPHRVADVLVGDETGSLYLSLWDGDIDKVDTGNTIKIVDGYVNLFRGMMRLNIGRYGRFEVIDVSPIGEVNTENNLSLKHYKKESPHKMLR